jgi:transposase
VRKSLNGLIDVVRSRLGEDPLSATLFVFVNRCGSSLKRLAWDRTNFDPNATTTILVLET